jgi:hypothetical protein
LRVQVLPQLITGRFVFLGAGINHNVQRFGQELFGLPVHIARLVGLMFQALRPAHDLGLSQPGRVGVAVLQQERDDRSDVFTAGVVVEVHREASRVEGVRPGPIITGRRRWGGGHALQATTDL